MQHLVAGESYSVKDVPLLEVLIDVRLRECSVPFLLKRAIADTLSVVPSGVSWL